MRDIILGLIQEQRDLINKYVMEGSFEISDEERVWRFLTEICKYEWATQELLKQATWLDLSEERVDKALGNLYFEFLIFVEYAQPSLESTSSRRSFMVRARKGAEFPKEKFSKPE